MIVEKGKRVYVGGRKFVEGDILPQFLDSGVEVIINKPEIIQEVKPKRAYRTRNSVNYVKDTVEE